MPPTLPHVILICTDDQGYGDIACHGNPQTHTPHLDAMARASTQLDNHHTDPLCSPSRAALMTGRYAARGGVWHVTQGRHLLDARAITLADCFAPDSTGSTAGYRTGMFGKWHLGDNFPYAPRFRGFQEVICHRGGGVGELPDAWGNDYFDDTYFHNGQPQRYAGYCTDVFFNEARRFLAESEALGAPAFIYLAPNAMHSPFRAPESYIAPYRALGIEEPRASFYGMIANFDENLGRLFADLRAGGMDQRTLTIFTSDHGTAAGYDARARDPQERHSRPQEPQSGRGFNAGMRGKKGSVYDGGHRVNCFLRWPGRLLAGRQIRQVTAHIDLMPTILALCGLAAPPAVAFDGLDLSPYLANSAPPIPPRTLFSQLQPNQPRPWHHCAAITDRWRLVNGRELYDMAADPGQERDVAAEFPATVAQLRADYANFWDSLREAYADVVPLYLGAPEENPTTLSARDWRPTTEGRFPWRQEWIGQPEFHKANGDWEVEIRRAGEYTFALSAYPLALGRPLGARLARICIEMHSLGGKREAATTLSPQETAARFRLRLPAGRARLQTWLTDAGPINERHTRGAYYVTAERVGD